MRAREEIVIRYQTMVYNLALRLLRDPDEAEVALQETFLKVFQSLPRFRGRSSLTTWIYRIATNEALQRLRSARSREFVDIESEETGRGSNRDLALVARTLEENPHRLLENRELRTQLEDAIGELPPKHRAAFVLVDVEGLPLKQAAAMADVPVAALKTHLHRARFFLRDRLAAYMEEQRNVSKR